DRFGGLGRMTRESGLSGRWHALLSTFGAGFMADKRGRLSPRSHGVRGAFPVATCGLACGLPFRFWAEPSFNKLDDRTNRATSGAACRHGVGACGGRVSRSHMRPRVWLASPLLGGAVV